MTYIAYNRIQARVQKEQKKTGLHFCKPVNHVIRIGFKPMTYCLAYQLQLSLLPIAIGICGLDYIFTISGVSHVVSTVSNKNFIGSLGIAIPHQAGKVSPI